LLEREKDFTAFFTFLSIGFCDFHRFSPSDRLPPSVSVALAFGDEGYHTKSPKQRQQPSYKILTNLSPPSDSWGIDKEVQEQEAGK
jgi:hypothetical protein